jgi:hypothetical protein
MSGGTRVKARGLKDRKLFTLGGPTGYLFSATNLHIKLNTPSVEQSFFYMHSNDDDDDDDGNFDDDADNNNNFNEAFPYQLIVYHIYAAMQSESVHWTAAVIRRLLLSPKVPLTIAECLRTDCSILRYNKKT